MHILCALSHWCLHRKISLILIAECNRTIQSVHEPDPENLAVTTTWGANSHYFSLKAIYLGISFLHDSSFDSVALRFYSHNSGPYIYTYIYTYIYI